MSEEKLVPKLRFECSLEEYKKYKLGELVENVVAGATPKTSVDDYWNGGDIPWLSSGEVHKKFIYFTDKFITSEGYNNSSTKIVPTNSVLIALAGQGKTRGTVAINKIELCTNQSIASIIPNEMLNYKYLFYYLESKYEYLRALSSSDGGRGGLNLKLIRSIPIQVPSIKEQENISNFINEIDKKILLLEQKHKLYDDFKKYLMQQIFTQKLRFTDYIEEWKTIKLKDVGEINTGNTPSTKVNEYYSPKKYLWVTPSDISSKYIFDTAKRLSDEGAKKGRFVKKNSVLVTCIASIGKNCIILEDGYFNQQINSITPSQSFDLDFIYYLIDYNSEKMKNYAGITATPILNKKSFENMKFEFPSFDEQKQISNMLSNIDNKIFAIEELINKTQKFKKGLLQQMFV